MDDWVEYIIFMVELLLEKPYSGTALSITSHLHNVLTLLVSLSTTFFRKEDGSSCDPVDVNDVRLMTIQEQDWFRAVIVPTSTSEFDD